MHKPLKVVLFGASLDTGNMGCRALALSLIGILNNNCRQVDITLIYGHPSAGTKFVKVAPDITIPIKIVNHRLSFRKARLPEFLPWILFLACLVRMLPSKRLKTWLCLKSPILTAVSEAEFIGQITGGDSFSDIYGVSRFLYRTIDCVLPIILGRKFHFLPQTYGPFRHRRTRWLARYFLRHAESVFTRDRHSIHALNNLAQGSRSLFTPALCPDVAFCLSPVASESLRINPPLPATSQEEETIIGINVSGLLWIGGYSGKNMFGLSLDYQALIHALIKSFLELPHTRILLIPHTFGDSAESDNAATLAVLSSYNGQPFRERIHMIEGQADPAGIKSLIGDCDFFIGSRMHSCIAAASQYVPCAAIAYSDKFEAVFSMIAADNLVLDARRNSISEILTSVMQLFVNRRSIQLHLRESIGYAKEQVLSIFTRLTTSSDANGKKHVLTSDPHPCNSMPI